jgi:hypothetical protein
MAAPWINWTINGVKIRPFIFAALVIFGTVPFIHWLLITPELFQNEVLKVNVY